MSKSKAIALSSSTDLFKSFGVSESDLGSFVQTTSGGVTKWVDLTAFQVDPATPVGSPAFGNGSGFYGVLSSRQEFDVDSGAGHERDDGTVFRNVYFLRLLGSCPVSYKNEDKEEIKEIAPAGTVVAIGERHAFRNWESLLESGGEYALLVRPHSRIKIGGGRTMWTFDTFVKTLRQPPAPLATVVR